MLRLNFYSFYSNINLNNLNLKRVDKVTQYRNYYKPNKTLEQNKTTLTNELHNLQQELENLKERSSYRRPHNNFFDLDTFFNNKLLLIGGCILLGIGIAYFLFNPNSNRHRC